MALQSVGCFSIVFEAVPAAVSEALVEKLEIPVIGIGAGGATDGQVLVFHDLLGIHQGHTAKFVKRYAEIHDAMVAGVSAYAADVRTRGLPRPRAHLQRRAPRARRVPRLPRAGEHGRPEVGLVGDGDLGPHPHPAVTACISGGISSWHYSRSEVGK